MDAEQWANQPWWAQRAYIEGFKEEELLKDESPGGSSGPTTYGDGSDIGL